MPLNPDLVSLAQIFLLASSMGTVALADTDADNEKLKSGISIVMFAVAAVWLACNLGVACIASETAPLSFAEKALIGLPIVGVIGWLVAIKVHVGNWMNEKSKKQPTG